MKNEDYDNDYGMTELEYQEFKGFMVNEYDIWITRNIHKISPNVVVDC